nr:Transposon Ty3-I Gag-Pol polyprotein [Ipomoea batatas]
MANEGMQMRYRSLEEQIQQICESQQKSADELRQALMEQNQALRNAINTAVTDLTLRMTQLNTVSASLSNYSPPPATPARINLQMYTIRGHPGATCQHLMRFGPSSYVNHRAALFKLTQKTTVAAYQSEFETVSNRVFDLHQDALLDCFISGLKPMIQHELAVLRPATLSDTIALARLRISYEIAGPLAQNSYLGDTTPKYKPKPSLPIKRLTDAELQARRAQGLYYNCDERFRPGHRCQTKPFLLLLADDPTDTAEGGEHIEICKATDEATQEGGITKLVPKISLHALEGTIGPRTFRLTASVKRREFTVLIDTGSSHNYIQPRLAHYLHLAVDNTIRFLVAVGNGERIQSEGTCTTVPFTMQGAVFKVDFHVLEFSGSDSILGVHWLESLGRIITYHKHLTMEFDYNGQIGKAFLSTRHSWFSAGFFIGSHGFRLRGSVIFRCFSSWWGFQRRRGVWGRVQADGWWCSGGGVCTVGFRLFGVWFTVFGSGAVVSGAPQRVVQCSVGFRVLGCRVQGFGGDSRWVEVVQCSAKFTATGWGGAIGGEGCVQCTGGYTQGEFGMPNARSEYDSWGYTQGEFGVPNARSEYDSSGYTQGESGVPNAGSEYMIPECDTSCKLSVGQKFDTLENGIQFYKRYAMVVGFDVRQSTVKKSRTGEVDVSMGSIQLQQTTAQQNTIPGGTLQHQVWMDFNACMGMARGDDQRLLQISHAMSEVKQKIQTDGRTVVAKIGNAAVIQTMCGTPSSLPVTIRPPVVAKNKGSGKRLKGAREKAVTSKKKGRKCHTCDLALGHDTRNCPLLDPVLQ